MKFEKTPIDGIVVIVPQRFKDSRGVFSESYKMSEFLKIGIKDSFVQENCSISHKGVLRGLHYQKAPYSQAKLVQCVQGKIYDVAIDLRPKSSTYLKHYGVYLSEANGIMLYIPAGFAHGFCVVSDTAKMIYRCSKEYSPQHEAGIRWNDPNIGIKWPIKNPDLSAKDAILPYIE